MGKSLLQLAIERTSPEEVATLLGGAEPCWDLIARPEQLSPLGDWDTWLVLAGRGFGKTRTGAEWVTRRVLDGARWVSLVGRTAADVRDVMVEGESGLLSVAPAGFRPVYEPSKRRVTWPNGAIATTYSAEKPDQQRGPQCVVGGTLVLMADGSERRIDSLAAGDLVQTRRGARRVLRLMKSVDRECYRLHTLGGRPIDGTGSHGVWIHGAGFIPLRAVRPGDLCAIVASSSAVGSGTSGNRETTTLHCPTCTERSGPRSTDPFPRASRSTTRTATRPTTESRTCNCSRRESTVATTQSNSSGPRRPKSKPPSTHSRHDRRMPARGKDATFGAPSATASTTAARSIPVASARSAASTKPEAAGTSQMRGYASTAPRATAGRSATSGTAASDAERLASWSSQLWSRARQERSDAPIATSPSCQPAEMLGSTPENAPSVSTMLIVSVEKLPTTADVYDIEVEGAHEFFANGILTHNSDTGWADELAAWKYPDAWDQMQFGNRLGMNPRVCVTTTPRPTPIIRELVADPGTECTGGSTYENFANLAPKFLRRILARYEGTRLGRQELLAQVLSDTEGALWTRAMIEAAFVRPADVPEMVRVVVGVDPAVSYREEDDIDRETKPGAETGIVVVGLGRDKHLYVWADYSGRRAPNAWAEKVAAAYEEFHCGRVIAEGNQGGNLVENILKTAHRGMAVKMVNASVGKSARAEPVSALYEQGKVHHVGAFPELEDQLTSWVPGESDSPDRLDALVWAITFLALGPSGEGYNGRTIVHPAKWAGRIR